MSESIYSYMARNVDLYTDTITGEVNESSLAEDACEVYSVPLEADGSIPDKIYYKALKIAQLHEIKTGARVPRIRSELGDYTNHLDADFSSRTA